MLQAEHNHRLYVTKVQCINKYLILLIDQAHTTSGTTVSGADATDSNSLNAVAITTNMFSATVVLLVNTRWHENVTNIQPFVTYGTLFTSRHP